MDETDKGVKEIAKYTFQEITDFLEKGELSPKNAEDMLNRILRPGLWKLDGTTLFIEAIFKQNSDLQNKYKKLLDEKLDKKSNEKKEKLEKQVIKFPSDVINESEIDQQIYRFAKTVTEAYIQRAEQTEAIISQTSDNITEDVKKTLK